MNGTRRLTLLQKLGRACGTETLAIAELATVEGRDRQPIGGTLIRHAALIQGRNGVTFQVCSIESDHPIEQNRQDLGVSKRGGVRLKHVIQAQYRARAVSEVARATGETATAKFESARNIVDDGRSRGAIRRVGPRRIDVRQLDPDIHGALLVTRQRRSRGPGKSSPIRTCYRRRVQRERASWCGRSRWPATTVRSSAGSACCFARARSS